MSDVMIEAHGLGKRYGSSVALRNASFELRRGEILGFLGPNGAGKSTAMKILTCFIAPTTGTATVAGCDIWKDPMGVRRAIGYLPESNPLYKEMLVLEYLEWVASMRGMRGDVANKRILRVIEEVRLEEVVAKSINQLSKGYRQRVGLAQALLHEPPILILDEPMTGLDPNQAREIRKLIKAIGKERTIILSTHNLSEVAMTCQRVLVVDRGTIVADDTPEALAQQEAKKYRVVYKRGETLTGAAGFRDSAGAASPASVFGSLRGVEQVRDVSKGGDGEIEVEIVPSTDDDLRADIFKAAVKSGLVVLELSTGGQSLEAVFQKLTTRDEDVLLREVGIAMPAEDEEEEEEDTSEEEEEEDTSSEEEEEETSSEEEEEDTSSEEEEEEASSEEEEEEASSEEEEEEEASSEEDEEAASDEEEEEEPPRKKGK